MQAWRVEIRVRTGLPDPAGAAARAALVAAGLELEGPVAAVRGFLLGADLPRDRVESFARGVLADPIADDCEILAPDQSGQLQSRRVTVVPHPGVTDPVADSARKALRDAGLPDVATGTYQAFELTCDADADALTRIAGASLANEVIQTVLIDARPSELPGPGAPPDLEVVHVELRGRAPGELVEISRVGGLALNEAEMLTIQAHFDEQGRDPTQLELETIAQTWSEHCKHKTLTGRARSGSASRDDRQPVEDDDRPRDQGELDRDFSTTTSAVPPTTRASSRVRRGRLGVCIKVETHNHPSAIEPLRRRGHRRRRRHSRHPRHRPRRPRPIANTDVFCVAPPDLPPDAVPQGCLHPQGRSCAAWSAGCATTATRWASPPSTARFTWVDPDYVGNPLVYVGNIG